MRTAKEILVTGHVQGVGFRWTASRIAQSLDVAGWVRNDPDGTVSIAVEGEAGEVEAFISRLRDAMGDHISEFRERDVAPGRYRHGFDVAH